MEPVTEIWKDVPGYEGLYQVSNLGRVKALKKVRKGGKGSTIFFPEKIMSFKVSEHGYYRVAFRVLGQRQKAHLVHRLVAMAFIPNPLGLPQINHMNGIKNDNRIDNLEWVTASQNQKHSYDILGNKPVSGVENKRSKAVSQYTLDGTMITCFASMCEVVRTANINKSDIWKCCNGKRKTAGGFIWRYASD